MKSKLSAAIAFIVLFGACFLAAACTLQEVEADATEAIAEPAITLPAIAPVGAAENDSSASASLAPVAPEPAASSPVVPKAYVPPPLAASEPSVVTVPAQPAAEEPKAAKEVSIPVLNYHSIGVEPDNTLVLDPDKFARQMEYLSKNGHTPLSLTDFTLILEKRKAAPPKPVLLTFDDGYSDNYELAMPVLKRYGFPATLFMSPGFVREKGYLNWDQVKEMHDAGWDIQPHGMTHSNLSQLSAAKQKEEITESRRQIEKRLGTTADIFCYPYGQYNKTTLAVLKEEGFRYAFTIEQGWATSTQPPLQLKRIYVNGKESLEAWSKKLTEPF